MAQLYSSHPEIRPTLPAHTFTLHPHSINKVFSRLKIQFFGLYFNSDNNIYGITDGILNPKEDIGVLDPNDTFNIVSIPNASNPDESMIYAYQNGVEILQQKFSTNRIKFFYTTKAFL